MDVLIRQPERLWNWVHDMAGFPGQLFFVCLLIVVGLLIGNAVTNLRR